MANRPLNPGNAPASTDELLDALFELYLCTDQCPGAARFINARNAAYAALDSWGLMGE